jgi:hypothetical protein
MTCHWYQQIKSHLYFIKPNEIHADPIRKIYFLLKTFQQQCMSEWSLGHEISIDEMIVLTKSVFSPIKIWINATQQYLQIVGSKTMNVVVVTLASKLPVRGFNIFLDNFYSIVFLF